MMRRRIHLTLIAMALSLAAHASMGSAEPSLQAATPQPVITYNADGITVTGTTPGGRVILFGISRRPLGVAASTARRWLVQTASAAGTVTFTFGSAVPRSSIYAAVDFETGAYAIRTPGTYPLRLATFPNKALRKSGDAYTQLGLDRVALEVLCVRPGKNAWQVFLTDCSRRDRDGTCDGKLTVDASALEPLVSDKDDLKDFKQHDVVIMIDPMEMDVMASEVGK